jgi:hypothetical protein
MLRAAVFSLMAASILVGSLGAQRVGGAFHGPAAGLPVRSGFVGQRGFSNGFFPQRGLPNGFFSRRGFFPNRFRFRHEGLGGFLLPYFFPDYEPFWYEQPYAEATGGPAPVVVVQQRAEGQQRTQELPPAKPLVIEVPGVASSTAPKTMPPTIFILANGERVEARRFLLTTSNLSVSVDRHERTIPLDMLDIKATIAANRERGIDLRIPADRNEISLSF